MIHGLFPKLQIRYERFSCYGLRWSDEGADTDLIHSFCWPKMYLRFYITTFYIYNRCQPLILVFLFVVRDFLRESLNP